MEEIYLSVVIPCRNESLHLTAFVSALMRTLKDLQSPAEVIFVENGSTDTTWQILGTLKKKFNIMRIFSHHEANFGASLKKGILKSRGKYVAIFNVDFWDERLLQLVQVNLLGYDMVICSKNLPQSVDDRSILRKLLTRAYNLLLQRIFSFSGTDSTGIRIARRKALRDILNYCLARTGVFDSELSIHSQRQGASTLEIPVSIRERRPSRFPRGRLLATFRDLYVLFSRSKANPW